MALDINTVIAAAVPTGVVSAIGFFLRQSFADVREGQKAAALALEEIKAALGKHNVHLAVLEQRLLALETVRITRLEEELGNTRQRVHDNANAITSLNLAAAARAGAGR